MAITLALGISASITMAFILPVIRDVQVNDQAITMLATMLGAAIGAIGAYLTGERQHRTSEPDNPTDPSNTNKTAAHGSPSTPPEATKRQDPTST
ncbi:hypothetical protein [Nocardia terpenica]|uniref:Uncharacterized protein n=1 Tax=Nocardia terpenica TaxID=455432 RepID=A0A6G9ZE65_9NOCA|nr:hypothetical protein [Nocardia terpenica]QIS23406.1 hypothetical protein F6W96_38825 [Nocardia terpenica]